MHVAIFKNRTRKVKHYAFSCRLSAVLAATPEFRQRLADAPLQAAIPGQTKKIINPVLLTPPHQVLATKPRIGTQHNTGVRPGLADLRHSARQLLIGAGTGIDLLISIQSGSNFD